MTGIDAVLLALALTFVLALVRVVLGPSLADRAIAADICYLTTVSVIAVAALRRGHAFVDIAMVTTLLGFLATLSLGWLIEQRRP